MGISLFEADRWLKELYLALVNEMLNEDEETETEQDDETKADCPNKQITK